jgi:uncharacterized protein YxeA
MKVFIYTLTVLIISSMSILSAQSRYNYNNSYSSYNYNNNKSRNYRNDNFRSSYNRNLNAYSRMSQRDRRRLVKLETKFRKTERYAWRDGRLSQRERRSLNAITNDINRIVNRYITRNRNNYRNNYNSCPTYNRQGNRGRY